MHGKPCTQNHVCRRYNSQACVFVLLRRKCGPLNSITRILSCTLPLMRIVTMVFMSSLYTSAAGALHTLVFSTSDLRPSV